MNFRKKIFYSIIAAYSISSVTSATEVSQTSSSINPNATPIKNTESDQPVKPKKAVKLESVVVTAQKRAQKLQEVPNTITAISGKSIEEKQIVLSTDVERLAPNLSAQGGGRTGKPRWFLRGIGTNDPNANQDGPLSIYVDDVVVGLQSNQSIPLFDIERVEVLRGPQGTLWGKNNTGGALNFISKKPVFNSSGYGKLTYGSYNTRIIESAVNGEIIDDVLAARVSGYYETSDGWAKNIVLDEYGPQVKDQNLRLQLLAKLSPSLDAQLILTTRDVDASDAPTYSVGATTKPGTDLTVLDPDGAYNQGGSKYIPPYGNNPNVYSDYLSGDGYNKVHNESATLKFDWQLDGVTLTSISALSKRDGDTLSLVGVPLNTTLNRTSSTAGLETEQVTQEFRLTSPKDQKVGWILGAYYYDLKAANNTRTARFPTVKINGGTQNPTTVIATQAQYSESSWDQDSESKAIFGNAKYSLNEKASVTVGLRYTREGKDITETSLTATNTASVKDNVTYISENAWFLPGGVVLGSKAPALLTLEKGNTWNKTTWDITPEYKFNEDLFAYLRVATGFRSGGYNQSITNGDITETSPETLTDYELGLKSTWLEGSLTVNSAIYYYDIKNLQLNIQRAFLNATTNTYTTSAAGESDGIIRGIEVEVNALPTLNWRIGGSLGLLHSEYKDFIYTIGGSQPLDASGNTFYRTPNTSFRLDTDYTVPLDTGNLVFGTDWSYRSKIYHNATVQNDPWQETSGYWIGNIRVSYSPFNSKWNFTGFISNVTDKAPVYLRQIANPNTGLQPWSFSSPRTWGLSVNYKF
jgi:iron complex outermembrane receptor protein